MTFIIFNKQYLSLDYPYPDPNTHAIEFEFEFEFELELERELGTKKTAFSINHRPSLYQAVENRYPLWEPETWVIDIRGNSARRARVEYASI